MKQSVIILTFIFIPLLSLSYSKDITSIIDSAIIFTEDAQLSRSRTIDLKQGENTIRFINLELDIKPNSIQLFGASGNKNISIVSTQFSKEPVSKPNFEIINKRLIDSIQEISEEIKLLDRRINNLTNEKALIIAHSKIEYKIEVDYLSLLKSLAEHYRESTLEIDKLILKLEFKKQNKEKLKNNLSNRLNENSIYQYTGVIEAKIYASKNIKQKLSLSYMISGVSWTPFYDIKSRGLKQPLNVSCKATIKQNTGINWDNISLTLSTRKPLALGTIPEIHPWVLYFQDSYQKYNQKNVLINQQSMMNSHLPVNTPLTTNFTQGSSNPTDCFDKFTSATHKMINKEYRSRLKYNVSGKNGIAVVELDNFEMDTDYKYYTVPKYDRNVYLVAEVSNYEQYDLIPAFANIFLEGIYVGKLFVNPETIKNSLKLMLGKDSDVIVDRRKISQAQEKQRRISGNNDLTTIEIELVIKSRKTSEISLVVKDQVPISSEAEIVIDILKTSRAQLDTTSGTLTWEENLSPQKTAKYNIKYEVQKPKNRKLFNF